MLLQAVQLLKPAACQLPQQPGGAGRVPRFGQGQAGTLPPSGAEFLSWEQRGRNAGEHLGKSGALGGLIGGGVLLERAPVSFRAGRCAEESSARQSSDHLGMAGALGGHKARPGASQGGPGHHAEVDQMADLLPKQKAWVPRPRALVPHQEGDCCWYAQLDPDPLRSCRIRLKQAVEYFNME